MERIGPYEIRGELGRGGMGAVYRAYREDLKREFALKVILPGADASPEAVARFQREAQAAAQLANHPGIVGVHDIGEIDGKVYFAMDLVEGRSLDRVIDEGDLEPSRLVELIAQAAHAVQHAHAEGILHRDLKPANIMVTPDGTALVTDFGLAQVQEADPEATRLTQTGQVLGTPAYMPPEQANGTKLDARADVYALGATLYEALCGVPPFTGDSLHHLLYQVLRADPKPLTKRDPRIPKALDTIALKCLAKEPERRYDTAGGLAADLERWSRGEAIAARPPSPIERAGRWLRRHKALVATAAVVSVVATGAAVAILVPRWQQARAEAAEAQRADEAKTAELQRKAAAQPHLDRGREFLARLDRLTGLPDFELDDAVALARSARASFEAALREDPRSAAACVGLAQAAADFRDSDTRRKWLDRAVEIDPGYATARLHRAVLYLESSAARTVGRRVGSHRAGDAQQQADLAAAQADLRALEGTEAREDVRRLAQAFLRYARGEYEQAGGEFLAVAKARVADPLPLRYAGLAFMQAGKNRAAIAALDRVVAMYPRDALLRSYRGYARMASDDAAGAIDDFDRALQMNPNLHGTRANRGAAKLSAGDYHGALKDLDAALRVEPRDALVLGNRGSVKWRLGDLEGALADYDAALAAEPEFTGILRSRAPLRLRLQDWDGAWADYGALLRADPNNAQWRHGRAMAGTRAGRFAEAIADCDAVLAAEPRALATLRLRALAKRRSGDLAGAVADLEALLQQTPESSEFHAPVTAELAEARRLLAGGTGK